MITKAELSRFKPFLGRIVVEILQDSAEDHLKNKLGAELKVSSEFLQKFQLVEAQNKRTPISKGKIVNLAPDAFGELFMSKYGHMECPKIGDIVLFIPNESYKLDVENTHHVINDVDIVGYVEE